MSETPCLYHLVSYYIQNISFSLTIMFLDILFLMRRLIHDSSALSTVANSLLYDISLRCEALSNLDEPKKEWISRLVTTGKGSFILRTLGIGSAQTTVKISTKGPFSFRAAQAADNFASTSFGYDWQPKPPYF